MPNVGGVYTPISSVTSQAMYKQALQIYRGQLAKQSQGGAAPDARAIMQRLTERYLQADQVVPADRGRMMQIINQAERAHDTGINCNQAGSNCGPLSSLNVDPTIEPGGARVRYRVVVTATDPDGTRKETRVLVDSDRVMSYQEISDAAIAQAQQMDPLRGRKYDVFRDASPNTTFGIVIVGAGKSR